MASTDASGGPSLARRMTAPIAVLCIMGLQSGLGMYRAHVLGGLEFAQRDALHETMNSVDWAIIGGGWLAGGIALAFGIRCAMSLGPSRRKGWVGPLCGIVFSLCAVGLQALFILAMALSTGGGMIG